MWKCIRELLEDRKSSSADGQKQTRWSWWNVLQLLQTCVVVSWWCGFLHGTAEDTRTLSSSSVDLLTGLTGWFLWHDDDGLNVKDVAVSRSDGSNRTSQSKNDSWLHDGVYCLLMGLYDVTDSEGLCDDVIWPVTSLLAEHEEALRGSACVQLHRPDEALMICRVKRTFRWIITNLLRSLLIWTFLLLLLWDPVWC